MINENVQKIYRIAKKTEYGINFFSKAGKNGYYITINVGKDNNPETLMKIEQELLKEFGRDLNSMVMSDGLYIKAERG